MAAEIRVDRITSRSGINTISFNTDTFTFSSNVGIGTTNAVTAANPANTQKLNVGIVTANDVYANNIYISGNLISSSEVDTIVQTTSATGVGSFATATYRSAAVLVQINQNAQYQVGRYLMIHDGTTVTVIEQAAVSTGSSMLGSFTGAIAGSNAELRVSMVSSGIATVTTKLDTITI